MKDLNWLLEKAGLKWKLKKGAKMIGEVEFLLDEMEKTIVRMFGISGIITIEQQQTKKEIEEILSYNSP